MAGYWDAVSTAVARWELQESTGASAIDSSGTSDAPLRAGLTFDSGTQPGPTPWLPSALRFNGIDQYASIPSQADLQLGSDHSIAFWCRATQPPTIDQVLVEMMGGNHGTTVNLSVGSLHLLSRRSRTNVSVAALYPTATAWNHVVGIVAAGNLRLCLNGQLAAETTTSTPWVTAATDPGAMGACDDGHWVGGATLDQAAFFEGDLADVTIFDRALSNSEVLDLFAGPEPTALSPPELNSTPRLGAPLAIGSAVWNGHANGSLTVTVELQASDDGTTGWETIGSYGPGDPVLVGTPLLGRWVRIVERASNDGGVSDPTSSQAVAVADLALPAWAVSGSIHTAQASVAQVEGSGAVAAQCIPNPAEL